MRKCIGLILLLTFMGTLSAQVSHENREFFSESLNEMRDVVVVKPDSCTDSNPCPVLIFLLGTGMDANLFGPPFEQHLEDLLNQGQAEPMLVVIPDARGGIYGGNGYWNSSVNGKYADYIVHDLVDWITAEYAILKSPEEEHVRGYWLISGYSMGGGGAARLSLLNPHLFSGFASYSGDLAFERFHDWFAYINQYEHPEFIYGPPDPVRTNTYQLWDCASVFSPDSSAPYLAHFPLEEGTGVVRDSIFNLWMQGDAVTLAREYFNKNGNPASSMYISIGASPSDRNISFFEFSKDFSDALTAWNIEHEFFSHDFGHAFDFYWPLEWANAHFQPPPKHQHDLKLIPSSPNFAAVHRYAAFTPCVLIQNYGLHTELNPEITCTISSNGIEYYADRVVWDSLKALNMTEIKFKEWRTMENNTYTITFQSSLSTDENRTNDTLKIILQSTETVESFESGFKNWSQIGNWGISDQMPISGIYCLGTSPGKIYPNNADSWVQFQSSFNLSQIADAQLTYWTRCLIEKNHDFGYVEVSADSGKNWQVLGTPYTGNLARWKEETRSLKEFCGPGFENVRLRFHFVSDSIKAAAGWFIDDISLHPIDETDISHQKNQLPDHPILFANYPNPFNPQTHFRYYLPQASEVRLTVFNLLGQTLCTLVEKQQAAGSHQIRWNGTDQSGETVPSGLYFYRLEAGTFSQTRKMLLLK